MSDTWTHVLKMFEPEYDKLKNMLDSGQRIYPDLYEKSKKYYVVLQESWDRKNDFQPITYDTDKLEQATAWSAMQLQNWQGVKRTSYDTWCFNRKKDATKFQMLFSLQWTE